MKRVVVIDDDVFLTHSLRRLLDSHNFCTSVYNSVPEASLLFDSFDVGVIDVHLPRSSGIDLVRQLRERSELPILFISGSVVEGIVCEALRAGGDDFLRKPFDTDELVERIRALLRRTGRDANPLVKDEGLLSGCSFRPAQRRIDNPSRDSVILTGREVGILELLWRSNGECISREEISRHVMRRKYDPSDRSIDVHISNLRAKLRRNLLPIQIMVERNVGYWLASADNQ